MRDHFLPYDTPYMWNLKKSDTNELSLQNRNRVTDFQNEGAYGCQGWEGWEGRIVREFGMDVYTLLHLKWITNKDLLYSLQNSAQCYVVAWMRGVFGRKTDPCIFLAESLSCSLEIITTLSVYWLYSNKE